MIDFFGIPSLHKHTRDTRDDLETLKTYLRVKCCKDMYVLEHSAANDPEAWTKLDEIGEKMQNLRRILNGTENLVFSSSEDKENLAGNYYYKTLILKFYQVGVLNLTRTPALVVDWSELKNESLCEP